MIAYFFRFIGDKGKPTGWVGFALAADKEDMIWRIDEFGDPYCCQIKSTTHFSWAAQCSDDEEESYEKHEFCELAPTPSDDGWRDPPWVTQLKEEEKGRRAVPDAFGYDKNALF